MSVGFRRNASPVVVAFAAADSFSRHDRLPICSWTCITISPRCSRQPVTPHSFIFRIMSWHGQPAPGSIPMLASIALSSVPGPACGVSAFTRARPSGRMFGFP